MQTGGAAHFCFSFHTVLSWFLYFIFYEGSPQHVNINMGYLNIIYGLSEHKLSTLIPNLATFFVAMRENLDIQLPLGYNH